jgi:uncharacterized repeat protein (TIGR01451 family)
MKKMNNEKSLMWLALIAITMMLAFSVLFVPVCVAEDEITTLGEIQKAIEESGAEWQAGNTSVSGLSFEEKQQLCGLKIRRYATDLSREGGLRFGALPGDLNAKTAQGRLPETKPLGALQPPFASPGEVLASWTATNDDVWGVGFDGMNVWASDTGDLRDYEYTTTGMYLNSFTTPWVGDWPADFAWNSNTNTLWQVNVGGDNCIYKLNPADGTVQGIICDPDGIWGNVSQRGLAYDPGTDTFYIGGWNDGVVYHIQGPTWANPGKIIDFFIPPDPAARAISGLAFAPDGTLWIDTNWCPDMLYQIDLSTHKVIQCFAHPEYVTTCYTAGGLACDSIGNLWMVSQYTNTIYYVDTSGAPSYPDAFDWRHYGGDWTTPIKDQGACGSCWAFGSLCSMEAYINIQKGDPTIDKDLSEQYLLSCSDGNCSAGWYEDLVLDYLRDVGTVDEDCFPYQADDTIPCDAACPDADCRMWQITDWDWVPPSTSEIQGHLLDAPLVAAMPVYEDFFSYHGGIYEHVSGELLAGHMINIVGYNDTEHYWICKNSWGTNWGENADFQPFTPGVGDGGWFRVRYGEIEIELGVAYIIPPITESIMSVNKTVFDETTHEWVEIVNADGGDTVRFRIVIPNPCYNLTNVEVNDILSDGLNYVGQATINGIACGPVEMLSNPDGTTTITWGYNASEPCTEPFQELGVSEEIIIEFDARITKVCSAEINCANATAYCAECMPPEQIFTQEDCAEVISARFYEDFEEAFPPVGWTVIDNLVGTNPVWERNDVTGKDNLAGDGYCAIADSDYYQYDPMNTDLISPVIDCTGLRDAYLIYDTAYENYAGYDWANVSVRSAATGGAWITVLAWNEDHPGPLTVDLNISAYADNQPDLQVRFNYDTKGYEYLWYWEVDNVKVCGISKEFVFDTGPGTYPSISGTHTGTITPNQTIQVQKLYTYPCSGTGGHSEYVRIWGNGVDKNASWSGYSSDWHNITFSAPFTLDAGKTYNYEITTGSYPQIIHAASKPVTGGTIAWGSFVDVNGNKHNNWILAMRLVPE